uniref:Glycine N-acyltransferase-like protein n=1 Tax=Sinocyclocheilus rhinocerous TaxID=307959 RepID=A0A673NC54_9TELE
IIILGTEELKQAESVLKHRFPESIKVWIFNINRGKPHNLEVIADQWPDFTLIICKPKVQITLFYRSRQAKPEKLWTHLVYAGLRLAPLSAAHAHLVNSTWKYGGDRNSYNSVQNYITHNPSLCVIQEGGTDLWYQHAALGLLYTLPQHRRKGYTKLLMSVMDKNFLDRAHPVSGFVEKENYSSYKLFTSLGFQNSPDYRAVNFFKFSYAYF